MKRSIASTIAGLVIAASTLAACDEIGNAPDVGFRSGDAEVCVDVQLPEGPSDFAGAVEPGEVFIFQGQYHYASTGATTPDPQTFQNPDKRASIKTFHAGDAVALHEGGEPLGAIKLIGSADDGRPVLVATQGVNVRLIDVFIDGASMAASILSCQWVAGISYNACIAETGATACCTGKYLARLVECNLLVGPEDLGAVWAAECEAPSGGDGGADGGGGDGGDADDAGCGESRHVVDEEVRIGDQTCEFTGWVRPVADGMGGCVDTYDIGAGGLLSNCTGEGAIDLGDEEDIDDSCLPL